MVLHVNIDQTFESLETRSAEFWNERIRTEYVSRGIE